MRRRRAWWLASVEALVLLGLLAYLFLMITLPRCGRGWLRDISGGRLHVGHCELRFPLTFILADVQLINALPGQMLRCDRVRLTPVWGWWPTRTIYLRELVYEGLNVQFSRTQDGTVLWPIVETPPPDEPAESGSPRGWRFVIGNVRVTDGSLEFVDRRPPTVFHGGLMDLQLSVGPIVFPFDDSRMSLAMQARVVGHDALSAPLSCSGSVAEDAADFTIACRLDPLHLSAFTPYYPGRWPERLQGGAIQATSQLRARNNRLEGRVQLRINGISPDALALRHRQLLRDETPRTAGDDELVGEIQIEGALDHPEGWQVQLAPGNAIAQQLVEPLMRRGRRQLPIALGGQAMMIALTPATEAIMISIEAAANTVEQALDLLTAPVDEPPPPPDGQLLVPPAEPPAPPSTDGQLVVPAEPPPAAPVQ